MLHIENFSKGGVPSQTKVHILYYFIPSRITQYQREGLFFWQCKSPCFCIKIKPTNEATPSNLVCVLCCAALAWFSFFCLRSILKSLIVWERDLDGGLDVMDTPSDKLVIPLVSPSALVNVAKMSMELFFWGGGRLTGSETELLSSQPGKSFFRLRSLRNHRCVLSDVTSGSFHQLAASFFPPSLPFFIGFIRLSLGLSVRALLIYLGWTSPGMCNGSALFLWGPF